MKPTKPTKPPGLPHSSRANRMVLMATGNNVHNGPIPATMRRRIAPSVPVASTQLDNDEMVDQWMEAQNQGITMSKAFADPQSPAAELVPVPQSNRAATDKAEEQLVRKANPKVARVLFVASPQKEAPHTSHLPDPLPASTVSTPVQSLDITDLEPLIPVSSDFNTNALDGILTVLHPMAPASICPAAQDEKIQDENYHFGSLELVEELYYSSSTKISSPVSSNSSSPSHVREIATRNNNQILLFTNFFWKTSHWHLTGHSTKWRKSTGARFFVRKSDLLQLLIRKAFRIIAEFIPNLHQVTVPGIGFQLESSSAADHLPSALARCDSDESEAERDVHEAEDDEEVAEEGDEAETEEGGENTASPTTKRRHNRVVMTFRDKDDMVPQFYSMEEDADDPVDLAASPEVNRTTIPVNNHQDETPNSSSSARSKRKCSPRDNVRRQTLCPSKWKANMAKADFNAGKMHVTPKGALKRSREIKAGCKKECRKCSRRLLPAEREDLHTAFWNLGDINRKRDYISRHVKCSKPLTSHTTPERTVSAIRTYTFTINNIPVKVCKKMFLETLDIADCWVNTSLKSLKSGKGLSPDKRGRHKNRPKRTANEALESAREHINSFARVPSHYVRERSNREYLEPNVRSVQNMYWLYKLWCAEKNYNKVCSESMYRKIFNREFNLGFFLPRKDHCALCNRWKHASSNEERQRMLQEYQTHLTNKRALKALRKKELEDVPPFTCIAAFDLQKVLTCPRSEVSSFFYRNKLSLYNFTIFECLVKVGHCYLWTEVEAMKGANEVGSNLYHFIVAKAAEGIKEFVFYSDGPSGQNRNRMVFSMYLIASQKFKVNITHRFLESGHSYSEADSMHARIENEVTLHNIYSVEEWRAHILNAKKEGETYVVNNLLNERVLDLHYLVNHQNWNKDTDKTQVLWSQVREVSASWTRPNVLLYRNNFTEEMKTVNVSLNKKGIDQNLNTENYTPPQAYQGKFPLKPKKAEDIKWLLEHRAIPPEYHPYYHELLSL